MNGKDYEYAGDTGKVLNTPFFSIVVTFKKEMSPDDFKGLYFFKFIPRGDVESDIANKLTVQPIDPATQTISLVFRDRNPERACDIVQRMADEFIKYDLQRKRESFNNIVDFLTQEIDTFGTAYDRFQDSVNLLRIQDNFLDKEVIISIR